MVLGKLPVPGRPTIWITVGQGPTALAVGADGGCLDIFTLIYPFSPLSPSLWETARYRLKYCLKGPLNPNNQPTKSKSDSVMPYEKDVSDTEKRSTIFNRPTAVIRPLASFFKPMEKKTKRRKWVHIDMH